MSDRRARVLLVGAGGLGSPAALVLARSVEVALITVLDDDVVDLSNLHRQTLYDDRDVGAPKVERAVARLRAETERAGRDVRVVGREGRFVPETARALVAEHDLVVEGADNFATKFLVADACGALRVPCVQAGAVRWGGWALACVPGQSACLRCVFEDLPSRATGEPETCAVAGVVGPVVGVLGSLEALLALRLLRGEAGAAGELFHYDGLRGSLRRTTVARRAGCPLCAGMTADLDPARYAA